ncbi:MAG: RDD family protein [Lentisphaeria bacterium]|nr:RDD family protein [Lentisphaeria bacterium]
MANERMYLVKTVDGEEMGPADQETLIKWAESGKIKPNDQVRSTMIAKWDKAINMDFLKQLLLGAQEAEVMKKNKGWFSKMIDRITLRAPELEGQSGIVSVRLETYPSASIPMRICASVMDTIIMVLAFIVVYFCCYALFRSGSLDQSNAGYVCTTVFFIIYMLYHVLMVAYRIQTSGQRYWGVFLCRKNGQKFWVGRVFFYFLFNILCMPIFIVNWVILASFGRTIPEILTGMRMVKVKLVKNRA